MAACFRVLSSPLVPVAVYTIIIYFAVTEAQTCIMGLPSNASLCTSGNSCGTREDPQSGRTRTRIIPAISFTCSGTVTGWRAAGEIRTQGSAQINSVLSIWRERSSGSGTYDRVSGIELGICGTQDPAPLVMSNIYECILPQTVSVQPGYIVGIELPPAGDSKFRLYFNSQGGPTNYVFNSHGTTFSLSQAISSEEIMDQPQISLTIVPDIVTTVLPTIQPSTTTEVSSTMAGLTTQPLVTSTSMATTDLEAPTSTEASSTMAAATDPSTSTEPLTTTLATGPSTTTTTEASITTMSAETKPSTTTGSPTPDTAVMTNVNSESTTAGSTATEIPSSTTDAQTPIPPTGRGGEAAQPESTTGTIAGAAVGAIIAVLLVLIIVLLLVLVLRRQNQPSRNANIFNAAYINDNVAIQDPHANASGMIDAHNMHLSASQQIPTEDNMAYNQVAPQFPTVDNVAYYDASKIQIEDNVAYSQAAASQLQFTVGDNVAYDRKEDDYATISDLNEYDYV